MLYVNYSTFTKINFTFKSEIYIMKRLRVKFFIILLI
jgi:hypothetical protein